MFGVLEYFLEHAAQPHVGEFASLADAFWWSSSVLTTCTYGDVIPITAAGRVTSFLAGLITCGVFALPAGIIAAGFIELELQPQP